MLFFGKASVLTAFIAVGVCTGSVARAEMPGPFGSELQSATGKLTPAISESCEPDSYGVTVRLYTQWLADHDRRFIERTNAAGRLEEPFRFDRQRNEPYPLGLACDGQGGFVVLWVRGIESCVRVRAFGKDGKPLSKPQLLTSSCNEQEHGITQLDYSNGAYRVLLPVPTPRGDALTFLRLAEDGSVVQRTRLGRIRAHWQRWTALANNDAAILAWMRRGNVNGRVLGLDGTTRTEQFRLSLAAPGATYLSSVEDLHDGTMIVWWKSHWQMGTIGRRVAVSTSIPPETTTTTTLPEDCDIPWFDPVERLQPQAKDQQPHWAWPPSIAAGPSGTAIAVWLRKVRITPDRHKYSLDASYSRRDPASGTWSKRRVLAGSENIVDWPQVVTDGAGLWMAMWPEVREGKCVLVSAHSDDDGLHWGTPRLSVTGLPAGCSSSEFDLAADPAGAWIAAWHGYDASGSARGVQVSRSFDRGQSWSQPATAVALETAPWGKIEVAGNGTWGAAWVITVPEFADRSQLLFSRSLDDGATWTTPVVVAGPPSIAADGDQLLADLATDGDNRWIITWTSTSSLAGTIGGDSDILISRSTDDGLTWSAPAAVASYAGSDDADDLFSKIATDRRGTWLLTWSTAFPVAGASGFDADVALASSTDAGLTWTPPVAVDGRADEDKRLDFWPAVAAFGEKQWVTAWLRQNDNRGSGGIAVMGATGAPVCE
ncbi:MAG TPA: sialidase family protein [Candidatus Limnocylindrales bacterium]|nr:sialidase family protein [Candidatus Limnocylindrales bacterium]